VQLGRLVVGRGRLNQRGREYLILVVLAGCFPVMTEININSELIIAGKSDSGSAGGLLLYSIKKNNKILQRSVPVPMSLI
jgi:hypothetical protein